MWADANSRLYSLHRIMLDRSSPIGCESSPSSPRTGAKVLGLGPSKLRVRVCARDQSHFWRPHSAKSIGRASRQWLISAGVGCLLPRLCNAGWFPGFSYFKILAKLVSPL